MEDIYNRTMTYYWAIGITGDKKVVARSYPNQKGGFYFDIGSRFPKRDPVSNLHGFFETYSTVCYSEKELKQEVKKLHKFYKKIETTIEKYR